MASAFRTNRSHACFDSCRCVKSASSNQTKKNTGWETENYAQSFHSFKVHAESFLTSKYKIIFYFRDLLVVPLRACICICMVNKKRISTERTVLIQSVSVWMRERVRTFPVTCQCFVRTLLPNSFSPTSIREIICHVLILCLKYEYGVILLCVPQTHITSIYFIIFYMFSKPQLFSRFQQNNSSLLFSCWSICYNVFLNPIHVLFITIV